MHKCIIYNIIILQLRICSNALRMCTSPRLRVRYVIHRSSSTDRSIILDICALSYIDNNGAAACVHHTSSMRRTQKIPKHDQYTYIHTYIQMQNEMRRRISCLTLRRLATRSTLLNPILLCKLNEFNSGYMSDCRDLLRGWGPQGFPTPEVDFPSLEFLKCYVENSTKVVEDV